MEGFIKLNGLTGGLILSIVSQEWDNISGAGAYTINKYLKDKTLYVTVSSSAIRNLLQQKIALITARINLSLARNELLERCHIAFQIERIKLH